jgi:hypothetical protein
MANAPTTSAYNPAASETQYAIAQATGISQSVIRGKKGKKGDATRFMGRAICEGNRKGGGALVKNESRPLFCMA